MKGGCRDFDILNKCEMAIDEMTYSRTERPPIAKKRVGRDFLIQMTFDYSVKDALHVISVICPRR